VPPSAPLQWSFEPELAGKPPHAQGERWTCVWLGSVLLGPALPGTDTAAVEKILFGMLDRGEGVTVAPWPRQKDGLFHPPALADLTDAYVAGGDLRLHEAKIGACTLQVAVGGTLAVPDSVWNTVLPRDLAPHLPKDGRALVCVVPTAGEPRLLSARRSWLLEWPAARTTIPAAEIYPGEPASKQP
jgi:hypothetical protein